MTQPSVFVALPYYGKIEPAALRGLMFPSAGKCKLTFVSNKGSLLAANFNELWCQALNLRSHRGITHFAMHHADIAAQQFWLDTLVEELEYHGADVMSAVIPVKDGRGLTSTGFIDPASPYVVHRRICMRELRELPQTFDAGDCGFAGHWLAVNTGLWVCRFTDEWVEKFPGFHMHDWISRKPDGTFRFNVLSEDWTFSSWTGQMGLKVMATRKVVVDHHGDDSVFPNTHPWGTWSEDEGDDSIRLAVDEKFAQAREEQERREAEMT